MHLSRIPAKTAFVPLSVQVAGTLRAIHVAVLRALDEAHGLDDGGNDGSGGRARSRSASMGTHAAAAVGTSTGASRHVRRASSHDVRGAGTAPLPSPAPSPLSSLLLRLRLVAMLVRHVPYARLKPGLPTSLVAAVAPLAHALADELAAAATEVLVLCAGIIAPPRVVLPEMLPLWAPDHRNVCPPAHTHTHTHARIHSESERNAHTHTQRERERQTLSRTRARIT
jgi:hypothetical protein